MFILLMQFIWKYIDDFMGKGLDAHVIAELLFYASANIVPMALPLAVLLSSIMTFGNLAEHYELAAMKSSGLSLFRIMNPLIIFIILLSGGAFYFQNNISPAANLRFKSLLWDITQTKPALELKNGVFYNGIEGYSIRVMEKSKDGKELKDVLIYNNTEQNSGNRSVVRADHGRMEKTADGHYLVLTLYDGVSYNEVGNLREYRSSPHPEIKSKFKKDVLRFDLSGFGLNRTDEKLWKNHMQMLSMGQLNTVIDSLQKQTREREQDYHRYLLRLTPPADSLFHLHKKHPQSLTAIFDSLGTFAQRRTLSVAINLTRNASNYVQRSGEDLRDRDLYIAKHRIEWHRKLTLSFACIVLFFIGAPLGAIIKKGGLGLPVVFSVIFFLIFHVLSITGEKMVSTGVLIPVAGMWLSSMVLFPISLFLTYKAANDASLFDRDAYDRFIQKITAKFGRKKRRI